MHNHKFALTLFDNFTILFMDLFPYKTTIKINTFSTKTCFVYSEKLWILSFLIFIVKSDKNCLLVYEDFSLNMYICLQVTDN